MAEEDGFLMTAIIGLFFWSRPTDIPWLIIAVWIGITVKAFAFRASSYIAQEGKEGVLPLFAHGNSASAISCFVFWRRIKASTFRSFPRSIFSARAFAYCMAVRQTMSPGYFTLQAAAAFRFTKSQFLTGSDSSISTLASTKPFCLLTFMGKSLFDDSQSPEWNTCKINEFSHSSNMICAYGNVKRNYANG